MLFAFIIILCSSYGYPITDLAGETFLSVCCLSTSYHKELYKGYLLPDNHYWIPELFSVL